MHRESNCFPMIPHVPDHMGFAMVSVRKLRNARNANVSSVSYVCIQFRLVYLAPGDMSSYS